MNASMGLVGVTALAASGAFAAGGSLTGGVISRMIGWPHGASATAPAPLLAVNPGKEDKDHKAVFCIRVFRKKDPNFCPSDPGDAKIWPKRPDETVELGTAFMFTNELALTSAHAFLEQPGYRITKIEARAGVNCESGRYLSVVGEPSIHPNFGPVSDPGRCDFDLAVLRLAAPPPDMKAPLTIAGLDGQGTRWSPNHGDAVTVVGFGIGASGTGRPDDGTRRVGTSFVDTVSDSFLIRTDDRGGRSRGSRTTPGDSGGPALRTTGWARKEIVEAAVSSSGFTDETPPRACAKDILLNRPAVLNWLRGMTTPRL